MSAKGELRGALAELNKGTLDKLAQALREEPYVCVANWVNCRIDENKPVGCLFAAAYMHTDTFSRAAAELGSVRKAMAAFENDMDETYEVASALQDDESAIGEVIEWFDRWGGQSSKSKTIEYVGKDWDGNPVTYSERVLRKTAQRELLEMIEALIAERS